MNKATQQEYTAAMLALDEICAQQRIKVNDKLREVFWQGFIRGWNRSTNRPVRRDQPDQKPIGQKSTPVLNGRDSRVEMRIDSAVGLPDPPRKRDEDLNQAGMFQL